MLPPIEAHVLISRTRDCDYVTLRGKGDFANIIQVEDLEVGDDPGPSGRAQGSH